ncbi:MAG TPA: phospholipase D-like domain-containing protein [Lacibacter sp.]|nr:phospholipase D-like domain-containing protein [Lacibacter sp.]
MRLFRSKIPSGVYSTFHEVRLIRGGRDYFHELHTLIENARNTLHLQVYIYDEDETGIAIADVLKKAAKRGVEVFVIVDGYASRTLSQAFVDSLTKAGVHFQWYNRLLNFKSFYFGRRLHHKVIVADARNALVGGINISNRYNDMPDQPAWLDWAICCTGEVCEELHQLCNLRWATAGKNYGQRVHLPEKINTEITKKECLVRMRRNDWVRSKIQITRSYLEMFAKAEQEIIIMSSYFLPGRVFRKAIRKAANRGVKLKVIVTGESDVQLSKAAERYWYDWLLRCNTEIYEYQPGNLHAKLSTYDGKWVTVGSYNVNDLSAYASIELNMDVQNENFAANTREKLLRIIEHDCVRVSVDQLQKKQTWYVMLYQFLSYEVLRLILFVFTFYFRQKGKG